MAIDTTLSITVGGALLIALAFSGMFYWDLIIPGFIGEAIPVFNFFPFWTGITWACIRRKIKEEKQGASVGQARGYVQAPRGTGGLRDGADALAARRYAPVLNKKSMADIKPAAAAIKSAAIALLLCVGFTAHAQAVPDPVQYILAPETPGPNAPVLIEAQGVGSFLGNATITWSQDGKVVKSGVGVRQYGFTTGALGTRTTIRVVIDSTQGTFSQQWTFSPSIVIMIWEADTTVPPLYRGKALYSAGSDLKVLAYPSVFNSAGARIAASALSYQWFHGDEAVPDQSGLGKNVFVLSGDQLQDHETINIDLYYGAAKVARGELTIPVTDPQIVLYPRDALRGELFDSAIPAAINLVGSELTVQAQPLYFSKAAAGSGQLSYVWTLNDQEVSGPDSSRGILTLRQTGSGQGSANLSVSLQNNNSAQFVQSAQATLQLVFGAQTSNALLNFFGL